MNFLAQVAISSQSFLSAIVWLVVAGLVFVILNWLVDYCGTPQPFNRVAKVIIALVAVILLLNALFGIAGHGFIVFGR